MKDWKLTADSTCDLSSDLICEYDVDIMGLKISLGDSEFTDGVDVLPSDIFEYVGRTKVLPKTGARSPFDYAEMFRGYVQSGKKVIHFSLSNELSSSYCNAVLASKEFNKGDTNVFVINTKAVSSGSGILIAKASELLDSGMAVSEVAKIVEGMVAKAQTSFCIETLEYLHKGGRCSGVELLGANLLNIHPCISMNEGKLCVHKKFRGSQVRVLKKYVDMLKEENDPDEFLCFVTHCHCDEGVVNEVVEYVYKNFNFKKIIIQNVGCTIASHCGKGTLGIGFINK